MELNTPIADDIRATDQRAQYDAACKRLLSEKIILAWIMSSSQAPYPSPCRKGQRQGSLIPLLLLSPQSLKGGFVGAPTA